MLSTETSSSSPEAIAAAAATQAATTQTPQFFIVYANLVDGVSWCGDCRAAEPVVEAKFGQGKEAAGLGVYFAGDREVWRKADNPWRKWGVPALPTLYKVTPDGTWSSLVEAEVYDQKKLDAFVDGQ
ncbi:hypothetical protein BD289DRAFT_182106 [Coniella lustricola]|uniref:Thioredoxin domain-containing protein n=1 Tax=Coniella lustricola TaxID=2025994 RepID=A0A2T2ZTE0_9PEZI|nr:hypothetical protein BD289DRAFT_182106 [Coniella lustricola]